jgi:hypothetical protein
MIIKGAYFELREREKKQACSLVNDATQHLSHLIYLCNNLSLSHFSTIKDLISLINAKII